MVALVVCSGILSPFFGICAVPIVCTLSLPLYTHAIDVNLTQRKGFTSSLLGLQIFNLQILPGVIFRSQMTPYPWHIVPISFTSYRSRFGGLSTTGRVLVQGSYSTLLRYCQSEFHFICQWKDEFCSTFIGHLPYFRLPCSLLPVHLPLPSIIRYRLRPMVVRLAHPLCTPFYSRHHSCVSSSDFALFLNRWRRPIVFRTCSVHDVSVCSPSIYFGSGSFFLLLRSPRSLLLFLHGL